MDPMFWIIVLGIVWTGWQIAKPFRNIANSFFEKKTLASVRRKHHVRS